VSTADALLGTIARLAAIAPELAKDDNESVIRNEPVFRSLLALDDSIRAVEQHVAIELDRRTAQHIKQGLTDGAPAARAEGLPHH
jgi:hypothetical protein